MKLSILCLLLVLGVVQVIVLQVWLELVVVLVVIGQVRDFLLAVQ
jgi:hypothetical protein